MHPFLDGNGRVARLMSHAMLLGILDTGAVWSVSRGLARNVQQYKTLLANCDATRRNDLDGRGALSEEALAELTRFFLTVCIDQVDFMRASSSPTACGRAFWSGLKRKSGWVNCPRSRGACWRRSSTAASCPWRGGCDRRHGGKAGTPDSGRAGREGRAGVGRRARAAAFGVSREPGAAVDAGAVPRAAEYMSDADILTHGDRVCGLPTRRSVPGWLRSNLFANVEGGRLRIPRSGECPGREPKIGLALQDRRRCPISSA